MVALPGPRSKRSQSRARQISSADVTARIYPAEYLRVGISTVVVCEVIPAVGCAADLIKQSKARIIIGGVTGYDALPSTKNSMAAIRDQFRSDMLIRRIVCNNATFSTSDSLRSDAGAISLYHTIIPANDSIACRGNRVSRDNRRGPRADARKITVYGISDESRVASGG